MLGGWWNVEKEFVFELISAPLGLFVFVAHLKQNKIPTRKIHLSNDFFIILSRHIWRYIFSYFLFHFYFKPCCLSVINTFSKMCFPVLVCEFWGQLILECVRMSGLSIIFMCCVFRSFVFFFTNPISLHLYQLHCTIQHVFKVALLCFIKAAIIKCLYIHNSLTVSYSASR